MAEEFIVYDLHLLNAEHITKEAIPSIEDLKMQEDIADFSFHYERVILAILLEAESNELPFLNLFDFYLGIQAEQRNHFDAIKGNLSNGEKLASDVNRDFLNQIHTIYPYVFQEEMAKQTMHFGSQSAPSYIGNSLFKDDAPYLYGMIFELTLQNHSLNPLYKLKHDLEILNNKHPSEKLEVTTAGLIQKLHTEIGKAESTMILASGLRTVLRDERKRVSILLGDEKLIYLESLIFLSSRVNNRADFKQTLIKLIEKEDYDKYIALILQKQKTDLDFITVKAQQKLSNRLNIPIDISLIQNAHSEAPYDLEQVKIVEGYLRETLVREDKHIFGKISASINRVGKSNGVYNGKYILTFGQGNIYIPKIDGLDRILKSDKEKESRFINCRINKDGFASKEIKNLSAHEVLLILEANHLIVSKEDK